MQHEKATLATEMGGQPISPPAPCPDLDREEWRRMGDGCQVPGDPAPPEPGGDAKILVPMRSPGTLTSPGREGGRVSPEGRPFSDRYSGRGELDRLSNAARG